MKVIISGGGTGGHIYPAIAIANELKARDSKTEILFVGAQGRMEMEKVPKAGYNIKGLWISGLQRKLTLDNLSFPFKVISSIWKARQIIREFKPDIAIGVGGYASGPLLYAAQMAKIPTLIQEQNSFAGITNKWLAKKAHKICVAYPKMEQFFPKEKIIITGNPVRSDILDIKTKREKAFAFFGLDPNKPTVLAIGGSLGARSINESIAKNLAKIVEKDIQLLWQTGKNSFEFPAENQGLIKNPLLKKLEFIYEMDLAYALADVVISRAGALAVSELCLTAKPCILVPLPSAAEDHQTKNALALVEKEAAEMVKDTDARQILVDKALDLLADKAKREKFAQNIQAFAKPNATQEIAQAVIELVKQPSFQSGNK
jgi:UDP-N-acetylglucosamine--N-acetylmuramyl-(pentapeptide) pyrophosphoryl-undecaprenol N-acetylglucosamine transferase